jgi:hypothetical protein
VHALGSAVGRNCIEFPFVQRQLLDQRVAQLGIVVDNQIVRLLAIAPPGPTKDTRASMDMYREVEHSG